MAENNASGHKRRKPGSDDSPDKSYYVLNKSLDVCGKCNKKCSSKAEAIQCDMCCMRVHAACDNVTKEQYKAIKSLSPLRNSMYYCNINNCLDRFNSITSEWIKYQAYDSTQLETVVTNLTQQYLSTEHDALQKAVSDLSSKIDKLQAQVFLTVFVLVNLNLSKPDQDQFWSSYSALLMQMLFLQTKQPYVLQFLSSQICLWLNVLKSLFY